MATAHAFEGSAAPLQPADGSPSRFASSFNDVPATAPAALPHVFSKPATLVRSRLQVIQLQDYSYSDAVYTVATQLRLFPPARRGRQLLLDQELQTAPLAYDRSDSVDPFGNRIVEIRQEQVKQHLTVVVRFGVENACAYAADGNLVPEGVEDDGAADRYLAATGLTESSPLLRGGLGDLRRAGVTDPSDDALGFAAGLCSFLYGEMHYASGATGVSTTAAEAWASRAGVCQDYAHIFLAICRLVGVPARYVSGFLPGEGAMHAWVEVLASRGREVATPRWYGLDPTHNCWVNETYVTVAVGRDYRDIVPNSGTYYGRAGNRLRHHSRVHVERTHSELYDADMRPAATTKA